jgi:hypothetical protein
MYAHGRAPALGVVTLGWATTRRRYNISWGMIRFEVTTF